MYFCDSVFAREFKPNLLGKATYIKSLPRTAGNAHYCMWCNTPHVSIERSKQSNPHVQCTVYYYVKPATPL